MPSAKRTQTERRGVGDTFRIAAVQALFGELKTWRIGEDLKILAAAKGSALVLPFVKGLRLSAQLIYMLRRELSQTELEIDWGHLLDDQDQSCSPECDIIIHHKGNDGEWNGSENPIMNFKFVKQSRAVAVISCKSYATSVDVEYVDKLRPYVKHVFLFAECCAPKKVATLRKKAKKAGYAGFGYLYAFDEKSSDCAIDENECLRFLDAVKTRITRGAKSKRKPRK